MASTEETRTNDTSPSPDVTSIQTSTTRCWRPQRLEDLSAWTYVVVAAFAVSSWIDINGVWVEVPLLVEELPEAWNLPSYLVIIIQIANIGPIVYTILKRLAPNKVSSTGH